MRERTIRTATRTAQPSNLRTAATAAVTLLALAIAAPQPAAQGTRARGTISVAAASDLQTVLPAIITNFERETGARVVASYGSSGTFFAQIGNGAPFDVFLSADIDYPRRLAAAGLGDQPVQYATGRLALWTRRDSGVDVAQGLSVLRDARVRRVAVANPEHAPYGRAAVAALRRQGIYDAVKGKLVLGENVSQAAQFAESGNAEIGLIALSLALGPALRSEGHHVTIPAALHPPIDQAAIVLRRAPDVALARRFATSLTSASIARSLAAAGFDPPASGSLRP